MTEDTALTGSGNLLSDDDTFGIDSDPDGDPLGVASVDGVTDPAVDITASYGTLAWNADGSYTYTLDNGNSAVQALDDGQSLSETFTYTLTDGNGGTDTATLTVTINGTNDGPLVSTAIPDQSDQDSTLVSLDISANFADVDTTDTLTYSVTGLPPGSSAARSTPTPPPAPPTRSRSPPVTGPLR